MVRSSGSSGSAWICRPPSAGSMTIRCKARALLDEALQQSQDALAEIRTLSRGIAPPILAEQGLPAAITALAARGTVPDVGRGG